MSWDSQSQVGVELSIRMETLREPRNRIETKFGVDLYPFPFGMQRGQHLEPESPNKLPVS